MADARQKGVAAVGPGLLAVRARSGAFEPVCEQDGNVEGLERSCREQLSQSLGVVSHSGLEDAGHTDRRTLRSRRCRPARFWVTTTYTGTNIL